MECEDCDKSWTTLPKIDVNNIPDDLELVCGSDKELKTYRIYASTLLEDLTLKINQLEQEIESLKKGAE